MSKTTTPRFGTDGIRGPAGQGAMAPNALLDLAKAVGTHFRAAGLTSCVMGRDTRASGDVVRTAMAAGLMSVGVDVVDIGVIPTAGTALAARDRQDGFGVMITASHNPHTDNGVKLFDTHGHKLDAPAEADIEARIGQDTSSKAFGSWQSDERPLRRYVDTVVGAVPDMDLSGLSIVLDCAHGAASRSAPAILLPLAPRACTVIGNAPNGININAGVGSTHPEALAAKVVDVGADIGIALDGDADRLIVVDERGEIVDGDQLLAAIADSTQTVDIVATVMSNLGLERYLAAKGGQLIRTPVGDKHVTAEMRARGLPVGGEQSGHLVLLDHLTTGDGTLAALCVLQYLTKSGRPASRALRLFDPVPQTLVNVGYDGASPLDHPDVVAAIGAATAAMGDTGRILVRASGTEPLIRVMAEGDEPDQVRAQTGRIADAIRNVSG